MEADKVTHQLNPGATFENALSLYQFDAKLRELIFDAIQKIEISLRSKMIHEFSLAHGAFWFFDQSCFTDKHRFVESMNVLEKELSRSKDEFIKEHIVKYGKSEYPPAWKTLELATFIKTTTYNRNAIRREFIDRKFIFLYNAYVHFLMIPFVFPSSTKGNEGKVWGNVGVWEIMENVL